MPVIDFVKRFFKSSFCRIVLVVLTIIDIGACINDCFVEENTLETDKEVNISLESFDPQWGLYPSDSILVINKESNNFPLAVFYQTSQSDSILTFSSRISQAWEPIYCIYPACSICRDSKTSNVVALAYYSSNSQLLYNESCNIIEPLCFNVVTGKLVRVDNLKFIAIKINSDKEIRSAILTNNVEKITATFGNGILISDNGMLLYYVVDNYENISSIKLILNYDKTYVINHVEQVSKNIFFLGEIVY